MMRVAVCCLTRLSGLALFLLLVGVSPALAQDGDAAKAGTSIAKPPANPQEALAVAQEAFLESALNTPGLVILPSAEPKLKTSGKEDLQIRLSTLQDKLFSNRLWKDYWEDQANSAAYLASTMANVRPKRAQAVGWAARKEGLEAWAVLATDKVASQERFYEAMKSEEDILESGLERILESSEQKVVVPEAIKNPDPYDARQNRLAELVYQLETQQIKFDKASEQEAFLKQQSDTGEKVVQAAKADKELASRELVIATDMALYNPDGMLPFWKKVRQDAKAKVEKLSITLTNQQLVQRKRQVGLSMAHSEVLYRERRVNELSQEHAELDSNEAMLESVKNTVFSWLRHKAPVVVISIFLIWLGLTFALAALRRGNKLITERISSEESSSHRRNTLVNVFSGVMKLIIYAVAGLMLLEQLGINTGPILGSVAVLGLAVSFGSQNLVKDVVNGFFLLLEDQYAVGDLVEINGCFGSVTRITIRTTWIRKGGTGELFTIPNGSISKVTNLSRTNGACFVDVGVAYNADLNQVEEVVKRACQEVFEDDDWGQKLVKVPAYWGVISLGDSSVNLRIKCDTKAGEQWGVQREMNLRIKLALDEAGIEIPFPQRVIHKAD